MSATTQGGVIVTYILCMHSQRPPLHSLATPTSEEGRLTSEGSNDLSTELGCHGVTQLASNLHCYVLSCKGGKPCRVEVDALVDNVQVVLKCNFLNEVFAQYNLGHMTGTHQSDAPSFSQGWAEVPPW